MRVGSLQAQHRCKFGNRLAPDAVADRDVSELFDDLPLDRFRERFLRRFGSRGHGVVVNTGAH